MTLTSYNAVVADNPPNLEGVRGHCTTVGGVAGIAIGYAFFYRVQPRLAGLHNHAVKNIFYATTNGAPIGTYVVAKFNAPDHLHNVAFPPNHFLYGGEGGRSKKQMS